MFKRRLIVESLETRKVLATFEVTSLMDTIDSDDDVVTLREAMMLANDSDGADTITFAPSIFASPQSIILSSQLPTVTESLTISGLGQEIITIDAQQKSRVLNIEGDAIDVSLSGLTITGGRTTGNNVLLETGVHETTHSGGGIRFLSGGTLNLVDSTLSDNSTAGNYASGGGIYTSSGSVTLTGSMLSGSSTAGFFAHGGGIRTRSGSVTLVNSTLSGNRTAGDLASGGGVYTQTGSVMLTNSKLSGNRTTGDSASGGGVYTQTGSVMLTKSTLSDNRTTGDTAFGGGIRTDIGSVMLTNSRLSGNRTTGFRAHGGGIRTRSGSVTLTISTLSGNSTAGDRAYGGGVYTQAGSVMLTNSTLSGNRTAGDTAFGGGIRTDTGSVMLTNSTLSGNGTAGSVAQGGGIRTSSGSVTLTNSTLSGNSTAGTYAYGGGVYTQAGSVMLTNSTLSSNRTAGDRAPGGGIKTDTGSVMLTNSTLSGNRTAGFFAHGGGIRTRSGSVTLTNSTLSGNRTAGDSASGGGVYTQTGSVMLTNSTLSGNSTAGVLAHGGGIRTRSGSVTLTNSTLSGNRTAGDSASGGGVYTQTGSVMLTNSTLSGNSTVGSSATGGALRTSSGSVTLTASTLSGNSTTGSRAFGGGISTSSSSVTLTGSTLSGNHATGTDSNGGGFWLGNSVVTIVNSTVTGNSATRTGGGLGQFEEDTDRKLTIHNSIVAGNMAATNPDFTAPNDPENNLEVRFSLIGTNQGTSLTAATTADTHGNLIGTPDALIDPKLGPLSFIGGPTQTHALLADSPALDAADQTLLPTEVMTDQRGFQRVIDLSHVANPTGKSGLDIGAVEMIGVSIADATANEFAGKLDFVVTLSHALPAGLTVTLRLNSSDVTDGATSGDDYTALVDQLLTFSSSDPLTKIVSVAVLNDMLDEADETLRLTLSNATGATITRAAGVGTITDDASLDFGDAPSSYPVTLANDGARHGGGQLFLGMTIDGELDGQPSAEANGDGSDEDGVKLIASLYRTNGADSRSSFHVVASQAGRLDAWLDFNADGDWSDIGEQIFSSVNVVAGVNILTFTVPASSTVGDTFARFRLSTVGSIAPTGTAADGEVEDYQQTIIDGESSAGVTINVVNNALVLTLDKNDNVVRSGGTELFRARAASIESLDIRGAATDDTVTIEFGSGFVMPSAGLNIAGGAGSNSLAVVGAGALDLTNPNVVVTDFQTITLPSDALNTVSLDRAAVNRLSPSTKVVRISAGLNDTVNVTDVQDWRLGAPKVEGSSFVITAQNQLGGNEMLEVVGSRSFSNFLQLGDVNNDGTVTSADALAVIFELNQRTFSSEAGVLFDPTTIAVWRAVYFDVNGDGIASAADALNVINLLFQQSLSGGSGEAESITALLPTSPLAQEKPLSKAILSSIIQPATPLSKTIGTALSVLPSTSLLSLDDVMTNWGTDEVDKDDENDGGQGVKLLVEGTSLIP